MRCAPENKMANQAPWGHPSVIQLACFERGIKKAINRDKGRETPKRPLAFQVHALKFTPVAKK